MSTIQQIPLKAGVPQKFSIALSGATYNLTFIYRDDAAAGWTIDIADQSDNPIIQGIPLVTGANLLDQYAHLGLNGGLYVQSASDPDAVPAFENLGSTGLVYWVTP